MYYGHMGFFGGIWMIFFCVAFIWLIVWLFKQNKQESENPIDIIKKRYAKGEITKKQYEEVKAMMQEQIQNMEQEQTRLQQLAQAEKKSKGLFGWLWK